MIKNNNGPKLLILIAILIFSVSQLLHADSSGNGNSSLSAVSPQITSEAIKYYKSITLLLPEFKVANYNYTKAITRSRRIRSVEKKRQELLKIIKKNQAHVQTSPLFLNDSTLKTELVRYLDLLYVVLKKDFDKILDMEDIEAQTFDQDEAHQLALDLAFDKLDTCRMVLVQADSTFYKTYNIKIDTTMDKIDHKMSRASSAVKYYNPIYKIFYKSNKQYSYATQALAEKDLAAMQQHTATLQKFVDEGIENLKPFKGYKNDEDLIGIVRKVLSFYKKESVGRLPENIDFYLLVEAFQNSTRKLEAIKPEKRTQKDVNEYNREVKAYNDAVKKINQINKASYKNHDDLIKEWHKVVDNFFEIHS